MLLAVRISSQRANERLSPSAVMRIPTEQVNTILSRSVWLSLMELRSPSRRQCRTGQP